MTEPKPSNPESGPTPKSASDPRHSALFVSMVLQYADLAMLSLGRAAHPETGKRIRDLDAARLFIDQLEMLEAKTRGNLTAEETAVLRQALMNLRLAFVEEAEKPEPPSQASAETPAAETGRPTGATS